MHSEFRKAKNRLVFNMSELNKSKNQIKTSEILPNILDNNYATSLDISKAYFQSYE